MSEETTHEAEYQKTLYASFATSSQLFEKLSLYIASGAFSLSFTFISDVIDLKTATQKWMLSYSWGTFLIVIFISLFGHFFSTLMHSMAIKNAGMEAADYNKKIAQWNIPIHIINGLIILGLLLGSAYLIVFIHNNLT